MFRLFVSFLIAIALAWAAGFVWFAATDIGRDPAALDGQTYDSIVVFTGGGGRIQTAVNLFLGKKAPYLFISGVDRQVTLPELLKTVSLTPDALPCCIEIGYWAGDTIGNAKETNDWLREKNFKKIILVTSSFHMRRSVLETRIANPELEVFPYSVPSDEPRNWLRWKHSYVWRFHMAEYHKYLFALARYVLKVSEQ